MAHSTDPSLQNQVIYSVFVRNHTPEGTFRALIKDLPRIRSLGVDIIWLIPIHPLGEKSRKGSLGSPYANRDYRAVNPEYGTMEDFVALVDAIHDQGMLCMIDVVYNHTSPDSVLLEEHPEFFWRKPDGTCGNRVGDWSDIIDLDYSAPGLWDYQIESLKMWAQIVDGFRCDAASLVPVEFWARARAEVEKTKPGVIWLAETIHRSFGAECRRHSKFTGMYSAKDVDAYRAFDIEYAYDVQEAWDRYLEGNARLSHYLDLLEFQESVYPDNYNKLRFLENHDLPRIASLVGDRWDLENLTAFLYFLKGTTLLYAGQEVAQDHVPTLFDKDTVCWDTGRDLSGLMSSLYQVKHQMLDENDMFFSRAYDDLDVAALTRDNGHRVKAGVFSLRGLPCEVEVEVPDGAYHNLVDYFGSECVEVRDGRLRSDGRPIIICGSWLAHE